MAMVLYVLKLTMVTGVHYVHLTTSHVLPTKTKHKLTLGNISLKNHVSTRRMFVVLPGFNLVLKCI